MRKQNRQQHSPATTREHHAKPASFTQTAPEPLSVKHDTPAPSGPAPHLAPHPPGARRTGCDPVISPPLRSSLSGTRWAAAPATCRRDGRDSYSAHRMGSHRRSRAVVVLIHHRGLDLSSVSYTHLT